jgi:hypothetical protein
VREFGRGDNSASERVLNKLKSTKLSFGKVVVKRIAIVKFRMDKRSGNSASGFVIKTGADTPKVTDQKKTAFG